MAYTEPVEKPAGAIREVTLGGDGSAVVVGGERALPFYLFDGDMPHRPRIAMEVLDSAPQSWPHSVSDAIGDVTGDPAAWARACVEVHGADMVCLQLVSTDPNGDDGSAAEAADTVREVVDAIDAPLLVYGSGNDEKDAEVLKKVAEKVNDRRLAIGPATESNYKAITAAALGYGHAVIAQTPIDVNMAKQLNILITQLGLDADRILVDPSVGAIGYGLEYAFTVMERLRLASLTQNDAMTQMPMVVNLGKEVWRAKEARATAEEEPAWGDAAERGVLWEATSAISVVMSGADVLVMRHPQAVALVKTAIDGLASQ